MNPEESNLLKIHKIKVSEVMSYFTTRLFTSTLLLPLGSGGGGVLLAIIPLGARLKIV